MMNPRLTYSLVLLVGGVCTACASAPSAAPTPDVIPTVTGTPRELNGLRVVDITAGGGAAYLPRKCVYTHYIGWLDNGTKFDSSRDTSRGVAGEPVSFVQGRKQVIDAWEVGFDGMRVGGTRRLIVPWRLGYGARGNPPVIPTRTDLVFDVELMAIADTLPHRSGPVSCPEWRVVRPRG